MSLLSSRDTNPTIQDITIAPHIKPWNKTMLNTFSMTSSRRLVIAKFDNSGDSLTTCAEPPPDVGEAFVSAVANSIAAKLAIEGVPIEIANQYGRAVSTQITPLIYRTQGLQIYRDAMHHLCNGKMNNWVGVEDATKRPSNPTENDVGGKEHLSAYGTLQKHYFDRSVDLIKYELVNAQNVPVVKLGDNPDIQKTVNTVIDLLKAVKPEPAAVKPEPAEVKAKPSE
jgi:hypothetical protein